MRLAMALAFVTTLMVSCAARRGDLPFQVLPAKPDYVLRSPDTKQAPFPDVLGQYTKVGPGWVELRPQIELRVENAYFRDGAPKHGLANFLGTEIARYQVLPTGALEQIALQSRLQQRPADQLPVQELLSQPQMRYFHHRLFFQVAVSKKSNVRSAVLLSAPSPEELDGLTRQLIGEPESVCGSPSTHCTVFPEACTASLEIEIVVNGAPRAVPWSSVLVDVVELDRHVELYRPYAGRLAPVKINSSDPEALRVPLLPGDHIKWR